MTNVLGNAAVDSLMYTPHSWKWGSGTVTGKVAEVVEEGKAQVTSNKVRPPRLPFIRTDGEP